MMYSNPNQYSGQAYQNAYPQYQQNYNSSYGYEEYNQAHYVNTNVQPVPPGEEYPQNSWAPVSGYANAQHHPNIPANFENKIEDDKMEALAQERKQQNAQLIKQREEYVRKVAVLRRELELLRNQKRDIMSEKSPQRDLELILKENDKLQDEIQSKMKAIYNVVEMLSSIIKDGRKVSDLEAQLEESPKVHKNNHEASADISANRYNFIHYDPELHWCRLCDEFPKTAKDLLLHLQSEQHAENVQKNDVGDNTPWHKLPPEPELPCYEGAPKKRIPIRGLQFFISAPAWYCKLCDTWIGDLHCASQHLKSQMHFQNYANFVEQNPHWEIEWLKDRERAMERDGKMNSSDSEASEKKKRKHKNKRSGTEQSAKDKKKKKRSKRRRKHSSDSSSSSSSSDSSSEDEEPSDKSKSIRVAMRNMKVQSIMNEDLSGKWEMLERMVDEHKKKEEVQQQQQQQHQQKIKEVHEDKLINQWNTVSQPQEKEKVMLDNLKDRMKQKQEVEKQRYAEMERRQREKDREEKELRDRKAREEQEARERFDRERKDREREEYERIRDKDRNQVKFKTSRDNYRKRRTPSPSPERRPTPSRNEKHYNRRSPRDEKERGRDRDRDRGRDRARENGRDSHIRSRSKSVDRKHDSGKKKPPGPPSSKRLPFIGRMPLFKNKKPDDRVEKEIKKEDYDIPRVTRFQPGNLAKAFLPQPDVVCFPKLSSYPPISAPPPPTVSQPDPPEPPKITEGKVPKAPPAPKIGKESNDKPIEKIGNEEGGYDQSQMMDPNIMNQYYQGMEYNMMYSQMYAQGYGQQEEYQPQPPPPNDDDNVPHSHTMPLQPPPLPPGDPSDDLAMLGISADDMAAQSF